MIKQEDYQIGSRTLVRTYTTDPENKMVCKDGTDERYYVECFDVKPCPYSYSEDDMTEEERKYKPEPEEEAE